MLGQPKETIYNKAIKFLFTNRLVQMLQRQKTEQ